MPLCEGITNYNQIRSDYIWTNYHDKQFDDLRGRSSNMHYADLDSFTPSREPWSFKSDDFMPVENEVNARVQKKYFHGFAKPAFGNVAGSQKMPNPDKYE